jgi:glycyl-tRNA synthetase
VSEAPHNDPIAADDARPKLDMETLVSLCKRRGFIFQSSEIYGGLQGAWDYGPLGVELKENVRRQWWKAMVQTREDVVGLDSAVILARDVWVASGHVDTFSDPLVECQSCHKRFRADHLEEAYEAKKGSPPANGLKDVNCPNCGTKGAFTEPRQFSGLLKTYLGPVESEEGLHYLRPETAQGIFVNFLNVMTSARKKPPFGIAQTGKSFRNEITPGNFIFRTREFEQMEMEYFVEPGTDEEWFDYWLQQRWSWFTGLGVREANLRFFEHPQEKLSHYSKRTVDIEYRFNFGGKEFDELEGVANRTDFDLMAHSKHSGVDLTYFDQEKGERWTPYVVEPALGLTRATLAFMLDAYSEDEAPNAKGVMEKRTVMRLDPRLSPVKAAVLPLSRNADLSPKAKDLATQLRQSWNVEFDDAGAIGRRYRRQDEIGTPFCITVDFDTLDDNAVTIRERDTMQQERVGLDAVQGWLGQRLLGC